MNPENNKKISKKLDILFKLGCFISPFQNWAQIFARNIPISQDTDLDNSIISLAFIVWYPTLIDFLKKSEDLQTIIKENYSQIYHKNKLLNEQVNSLVEYSKKVAGLLSFEDQIFVRDRRLQNVHGHLYQYEKLPTEKIGFDYFSPERNIIEHKKILSSEWHNIVKIYYENNMIESELNMRHKIVTTTEWLNLASFQQSIFTPNDLIHIQNIIELHENI